MQIQRVAGEKWADRARLFSEDNCGADRCLQMAICQARRLGFGYRVPKSGIEELAHCSLVRHARDWVQVIWRL